MPIKAGANTYGGMKPKEIMAPFWGVNIILEGSKPEHLKLLTTEQTTCGYN